MEDFKKVLLRRQQATKQDIATVEKGVDNLIKSNATDDKSNPFDKGTAEYDLIRLIRKAEDISKQCEEAISQLVYIALKDTDISATQLGKELGITNRAVHIRNQKFINETLKNVSK